MYNWVGWKEALSWLRTGHVPPEMILSKDKASGIPYDRPLLCEAPPMDLVFSSPFKEALEEAT